MILHIHNGDATADIAKQSLIPGEHFVWREALIEGPTPAGVKGAEWRRRRAQHLAEAYGEEWNTFEQELVVQEEKLASFSNYDEVVLWFEHDLFCQIHLIYLLNWFASQQLENTKLSLVCIDSFPGKENFRGLGELDADELSSLFPAREPVTKEQLDLSVSAWEVYRSPDPRDIQTLVNTETTSLPFLGQALKAHLRRFPSTSNGLGVIENRGLQLIHSGLQKFGDLFPRFSESEPIYGLGDAQFWLALRRMTDTGQPLLEIDNGHNAGADVEGVTAAQAKITITALGEAVMNAKADFVVLNGIDLWLGGVYLSAERNLWRWDQESEKVILN